MNRFALLGMIAGVAMLPAGFTGCSEPAHIEAASVRTERGAAQAGPEVLLASVGRVEGRSDTIQVGAAADGIIAAVHAREGQVVRKGDVLAEIGCADLQAGMRSAQAEANGAREARVRLLRGSREEERQMAAQKTAAARAVQDRAQLNLERMKALFDRSEVSQATYDDARRDYRLAEANLREAARHEQLVNAPPLPEDIAKIDAQIAAADSNVNVIREKIRKCSVVAPIDGTILSVEARPGESFSTIMPRPLFQMADLSRERVRAEVDERDVPQVRGGQPVLVFVEGRQDRKFSGRVARVAPAMGTKKILTRDPSDKIDRDVLEAWIDLEGKNPRLPVGMRVVVQFLR